MEFHFIQSKHGEWCRNSRADGEPGNTGSWAEMALSVVLRGEAKQDRNEKISIVLHNAIDLSKKPYKKKSKSITHQGLCWCRHPEFQEVVCVWLQTHEALLMWPELRPAASDRSTLTRRNLKR